LTEQLIDVLHLGREKVIGSWLVDGETLVDPGPASCIDTLLGSLGDVQPRVIALTHIHLDHAGATGALCERWPDAQVWVHERGAPHIVDPTKLMRSATRLYGDDMDRLWGPMTPVPAQRIRIMGDETIDGWRIAHTPGHASHHVTYLNEATGTAFTGDVAGVRIADGPVLAPTPPPDIDLEAWGKSLDLIAGWNPARIAPTHFGAFDDVDAHLDGLRAWLGEWGPAARDLAQDDWIARYRAWLAARLDDPTAAATLQAAPPEQLWAGLDRYWTTRES